MANTTTWGHVGDIGTYLEVEFWGLDGAAKDISSASAMSITVEKPDGTVVVLSGAFTTTGSDGKLRHGWTSGELVAADVGLWRVQGTASGAGFDYTTNRGLFRLRSKIA